MAKTLRARRAKTEGRIAGIRQRRTHELVGPGRVLPIAKQGTPRRIAHLRRLDRRDNRLSHPVANEAGVVVIARIWIGQRVGFAIVRGTLLNLRIGLPRPQQTWLDRYLTGGGIADR